MRDKKGSEIWARESKVRALHTRGKDPRRGGIKYPFAKVLAFEIWLAAAAAAAAVQSFESCFVFQIEMGLVLFFRNQNLFLKEMEKVKMLISGKFCAK